MLFSQMLYKFIKNEPIVQKSGQCYVTCKCTILFSTNNACGRVNITASNVVHSMIKPKPVSSDWFRFNAHFDIARCCYERHFSKMGIFQSNPFSSLPIMNNQGSPLWHHGLFGCFDDFGNCKFFILNLYQNMQDNSVYFCENCRHVWLHLYTMSNGRQCCKIK